jgi:hypothetical protein
MGLCHKKRLLDADFVWEMFGEWALYYWKLCGERYMREREVRPSVDENHETLLAMIERRDQERGERPQRLADPKEIGYFLDEERGAVD